ncbi:hypothetical protein M0805_002653 [Coniferiporia weirii]|nr:hypothetical protein M0805_002653 [Coniferiporia weirii]
MESVSVAPARVATLPSPSLKRESPMSPVSASVASTKGRDSNSPAEIIGALSLAAPPKDEPEHPADRRSRSRSSASPSQADTPAGQTPSADDVEKGLAVCSTCGESIPFRDPQSGVFTLRLWNLHREQCRSQEAPRPEPFVFTPETTADTMANPPLKKRRAKRTEEERIEYLRTDPYVAQYEAYRVLCGSCNKWIRLRPNSTYCSIPWDAHRKSCLSKKANSNAKSSVAAEGRNAILLGDPDVRRFDAERVMCAHCDRWIPIRADGGFDALQSWHAHREECPETRSEPGLTSPGRTATNGVASPNGSAVTEGARVATQHTAHHPPVSRSTLHSLSTTSPSSTTTALTSTRAAAPSLGSLPAPSLSALAAGSPHTTPSSLASSSPRAGFKDLHLGAGGSSAQDSRRRNAEQRAAALRADPLLKEVEPNRVFCGLCGKWVQLRQDSSFCAYPWHQHRGKCLTRYQRRQEKAHDYSFSAIHNGPYEQSSARYELSGHSSSRLGGDLDGEGELEDELDSDDDHMSPGGRTHPLDVDSDDDVPDAHDEARRFAPKRKLDSHGGHAYIRTAPHAQNGVGSEFGRYKLSAASPHVSRSGAGAGAHGSGRYASAYTYTAPSASVSRSHSTSNDVSMDEDERDGDAERRADVDMAADLGEMKEQERRKRYSHGHGHGHGYDRAHVRGQTYSRRRVEIPHGLADLDTPNGRLTFISTSVRYLFRTTYERADELSIGALVNYLNAAMPTDKHEDFDVQEVTRVVSSLAKSGELVQEGDRVRLRD